MTINLVWFRSDLRVRYNPALYFACKNNESIVLALFISSMKQWKLNLFSSKKISLIYKNVISLRKELRKLNIILYYYESTTFSKSINYLVRFCKKNKVNNLYYNYEYEFFHQKRDIMAMKILKNNSIFSYGFHGSTLIQPGIITNKTGNMYKKYSFFKKKCIQILATKQLNYIFKIKKRKKIVNHSNYKIPSFRFSLEKFNEQLFPIGEKKVIKKLKLFLKNKLNNYNSDHNSISLNSTSMISAHLSIGVISPLQCLLLLFKYRFNVHKYSVEKCLWINELIWREFFKHLLYFYPLLYKETILCNWEKNITWKNNKKHFNAWKIGKTGFPIVDAGMRQLNQIGWIHNRLRMITSSFLVKNLLINWKKGEKYFMSQLIDGDVALNNGGWQWISSVGSDSVPYFRIFNPILQSKKFDPKGVFIKKYVPELKKISSVSIHDPNLWHEKVKKEINYPQPIIDFSHSRRETLTIFRRAKYKL
ncbi:MAG: deoxyribodipyrimidine photo-lyase [Buchnera aphidicola (Kaburagia rhusicola ensigallis)]